MWQCSAQSRRTFEASMRHAADTVRHMQNTGGHAMKPREGTWYKLLHNGQRWRAVVATAHPSTETYCGSYSVLDIRADGSVTNDHVCHLSRADAIAAIREHRALSGPWDEQEVGEDV